MQIQNTYLMIIFHPMQVYRNLGIFLDFNKTKDLQATIQTTSSPVNYPELQSKKAPIDIIKT